MEFIKGPIKGAQKICIYGVEGIGKTYLASKFPNPVFIDTEDSTKHIDVTRTPKPTSWAMLIEQVNYFKNNPSEFNTLIIDTVDWAEQLCIADICAKHNQNGLKGFGYGAGYVYLAEEFSRFLNLLTEIIDAGMNVVLVAHAFVRKIEQPDELGAYDHWELKLEKKTAPLIKEWVDMLLFCNYKTYVINIDGQGTEKGKNKAQGGKRVMYTTHNPAWDAKNRHNLPDELPLDFEAIRHCFNDITISEPVKPQQITPATQPGQKPQEAKPQTQPEATPDTVEKQPETAKEAPGRIAIDKLNPDIPQALRDLMAANNVSELDIQLAVAEKGYYPSDTPITNYDTSFVQGVLISAWPQVFQLIKKQWESIPF